MSRRTNGTGPGGSASALVEPVLPRSDIFPDMDPVLTRLLRPVTFRRRSVIFVEGEPADLLYIIADGKVKISHTVLDGRETVLMVAGPADLVGALSLFDSGPRSTTATALVPVTAYAMDRAGLHQWIATRPEVAEGLLRWLARRLRRSNALLSELVFNDVPARVARMLLQLARRFGTDIGSGVLEVEHDLTQGELAQLIGTSRETVNKTLSDFTDRGWLRYEPGSVLILQPERLARRAR